MDDTNNTYTSPPSQSQRLARGVAEISEVVQKMTHELLLQVEKNEEEPQRTAGAQEVNLHWLNNDSMEISMDKILSQKFCLNNLADLLGDIHSSLFGTVLLMRNMNGDSALPGFVVQMIGDDMQKKLDLLLSIQSYCEALKTKPAGKDDI